MFKQAFEQSEELQEDIILLSNMFSNRLGNLVDSFDEDDIISRHQNKNATSPQLPATERDRVASHSESEERIKYTNGDRFNVNFFH